VSDGDTVAKTVVAKLIKQLTAFGNNFHASSRAFSMRSVLIITNSIITLNVHKWKTIKLIILQETGCNKWL